MNKLPQVIQMAPKNVVHPAIVYIPVPVDQHVSEASHLLQTLTQICRNYARFTQYGETLGVFLWCPMQSLGTHVETDLHRCFNGNDQTIAGQIPSVAISQEYVLRNISQFLQPLQRLLNVFKAVPDEGFVQPQEVIASFKVVRISGFISR